MPLLAFFKSDPATVGQLTIEQVVSNAGDGVLKDNSICSGELREYASQVLSDKIAQYINHCLSAPFSKGGMVLQDLVNEFGRRLDYQVTNGRYQGTTNTIGFDGLWLSPEGHSIIVEVKTTDAYRISLDTIAGYRGQAERNRPNTGQVIYSHCGRARGYGRARGSGAWLATRLGHPSDKRRRPLEACPA